MTDAQCHTFSDPREGEVFIGIDVHGKTPLARLIRFFQHGKGTHAKFIRGNGRIIENFYPHVRERDWLPGERENTEVYRIAGSTPEDWGMLESWFNDQLKHPAPYSIADLFRYLFNLKPAEGRQCFCSMWVLRGLRLNLSPCKQPLVRLQWQDYGSPSQIRNSPLAILGVSSPVNKQEKKPETHHDRDAKPTANQSSAGRSKRQPRRRRGNPGRD